jgi:HEAT repeat protein
LKGIEIMTSLLRLLAIAAITVNGCDSNEQRRNDAHKMQRLKEEFLATASPNALTQLEAIASTGDSFRRTYAISTIGSIGPKAAHSIPILILALNSDDGFAEREAARALGPVSVGTDLVVDALLQKLSKEPHDSDSAWFAAESLGVIGKHASKAISILRQRLTSPNESMAYYAKQFVNKIEQAIQSADANR